MSVASILQTYLPSIDEDTRDFLGNSISECELGDKSAVSDIILPFIEGYASLGNKTPEEFFGVFYGALSALIPRDATVKLDNNNGNLQVLEKNLNITRIAEENSSLENDLWGFDKIRARVNNVMEISEAGSSKYERKAEQEQRKWLSELESKFVGEDEDTTKVCSMILPDFNDSNSRECDINVMNVNINYSGSLLLDDADLKIVYGRRYGLVGKNGVGKTTLLKHIASYSIEGFPKHHRVLHVRQEVSASERSVYETVMSADVERNNLLAKEKELLAIMQSDEPGDSATELDDVYARMDIIGAKTAEARVAAILAGLQFTDDMQHLPTSALSGGWRMRVSLAAALFITPDLLMLDEPTNHLDLQAVLWLEHYLLTYPHTVLVVSHDRAFLDEVCTDVIHFKNKKLTYYRGNYSIFEGTRKEMMLMQRRQFESQQAKIAHMQEFVDKFRYNAKRASLVQSRIKAIEKEEVIELEEDDTSFHFAFPECGLIGSQVVTFQDVSFGFPVVRGAAPANSVKDCKLLFEDVNLSISQTSRIALVGPNGCGKSTLLNLILSKLNPLTGLVRVSPQLRISVFTQYHMDSFDLSLSPLQNMMNLFPKAPEADLRAHLGKYEVTGNDSLKPMKYSSGGQKSRVAFASMTFNRPHLIVLDEPTNHLDMDTIAALSDALKSFQGGVLLISHDQYFIKAVCNEIWMIKDRKVRVFPGSFDEYKALQLQSMG